MANLRLSGSVLGQLANPQFARAAGVGIGEAMLGPQRRRERKEKEEFAEQLLSASGDPKKIANLLTTYAAQIGDPELAIRGAGMLAQQKQAERTQEGEGALIYLQDQMRRTLQTPLSDDFTAEDQQQMLNNLQASANAVASNIRGLDRLQTANMSMNMENAVFQQQAARKQEARADQAMKLRFKGHEMALEKHREYMRTADYREQMRGFARAEAMHNAAIKAAKQSGGTDEDRAKFLQNFPDMEGIWDSVTAQKESQRLQLEQMRLAAKDNTFDYTDEQIFDLLGTPADERKEDSAAGKANLKAIERLRVLPPKRANEVLQAAVQSSFARAKPPPAALVGLFKDAAMAYTAGQFGVSDEKEEGQAAQLALKAAQAYMQAGSGVNAFQAALEAMAIESERGGKQSESELIKELRQLETQYVD